MAATKVELFERIRRDSWREGLSVRALARKYGVHRRLVREALTHAEPVPRKTPVRRSRQLEPLKEIIDGWLRADLDAPRKQRHTVTRIHARLVAEHEAAGVSYSAVRDYVSRRRAEIAEEEGRGPAGSVLMVVRVTGPLPVSRSCLGAMRASVVWSTPRSGEISARLEMLSVFLGIEPGGRTRWLREIRDPSDLPRNWRTGAWSPRLPATQLPAMRTCSVSTMPTRPQ